MHTDTVTLCQNVLKIEQAKDQRDSLFDSFRGLYVGLASFILMVEHCELPNTTLSCSFPFFSFTFKFTFIPNSDGSIVAMQYVTYVYQVCTEK
jgi:hypothetical protein